MEEQITSLENMPKEAILKTLGVGIKKFFNNFGICLKFMIPAFHATIASFLMISPVFVAALNFKNFKYLAPILMTAGVIYFIWSFWNLLLGAVAISYFAKDIYENKEIKTINDYMGYVKYHQKSFVKYLLWYALISIIISIPAICYKIYAFKNHIDTIPNPALFAIILICILLLPLSIGLSISYLFWAYRDKSKNLQNITASMITPYKDPVGFVLYFILLVLAFSIIVLPIFILFVLLSVFVFVPYVSKIMPDYNTTISTISLIVAVLQNFIYFVGSYFISFCATRYYFQLNKK